MGYAAKSIFSERLREARIMRGLTQEELAERAVINRISISVWENGRQQPSLGNFFGLAWALEVSCDYLLGHVEDPNPVMNDDPFYRTFENLTIEDRDIVREFTASMNIRGKMRDRADELDEKNERLIRSYEIQNSE